jgi:hypothetical protein
MLLCRVFLVFCCRHSILLLDQSQIRFLPSNSPALVRYATGLVVSACLYTGMYRLGLAAERLGCIGSSLDSILCLPQGLARVPGMLLYYTEDAFLPGLESLPCSSISVYCIGVFVEYLLGTGKPSDVFGISGGLCCTWWPPSQVFRW